MEELQPDDPQRVITKDELNLAEFPFSLPCHRAPKGRTTIQIVEQGLDSQRRPVERRWTVHASRVGLPLAIDEELFLGLMHFLHRNQFQDRHVYFTQHSLFQVLGWEPSQLAYERLKRSLARLKGSTIECTQSFWDHKGKSYVDSEFSLIDSFSLYRRKDDHRFDQPFISSVTFNEWIFESMKTGFIKTLDLNLYLTLKSPIARKLFRFLDKKLHRSEVFEIDMMKLANRLALTDSVYPADVRKQLERGAHTELTDIGFLRGVRYLRRGKSTSLEYRMAPREHWRFPEQKPRVPTQQDNPLVVELVKRSITRNVAVELVLAHGEKRVADKLEVFDFLRSSSSPLLSKNPAGFLRSSIEKDFAAPTGYISRAERQRRKDEEAEARRRDRELAEAQARAEQERELEFQALWEALSSNERTQMEAEVLLTLNSFSRKAYEKEKAQGRQGPGHHTLRTGLHKLLEQRRELAGAAASEPAQDLA